MFSHTESETVQIILNFLEENSINIEDCHGQSYDNAANMRGKYNGVKTILHEKCSIAQYVLCATHSLNVVGKGTAEGCSAAARILLSSAKPLCLACSIYPSLAGTLHRKHL